LLNLLEFFGPVLASMLSGSLSGSASEHQVASGGHYPTHKVPGFHNATLPHRFLDHSPAKRQVYIIIVV